MNLLFDVTGRMTYFRDVSFKGQSDEFSTFAYRCHRQQRMNVRCFLKS